MSQRPTADEIRQARFRPVRLRAGYDMDAVDELLDRLADACGRGEDPAPLVAAARFPLVKMREGYAIEEVDDFLERLQSGTAVEQAGSGAAGEPVPLTATDSVVVEQKGLLGRLFGRR